MKSPGASLHSHSRSSSDRDLQPWRAIAAQGPPGLGPSFEWRALGRRDRKVFLLEEYRTKTPTRSWLGAAPTPRSVTRHAATDHKPGQARPASFSPYSGPASDCKTRNDSPGPTFVVSSQALRAYAFVNARCFWLSRHRGRFGSARAGLNSKPVMVREGWLRSATHRSTMCLT